MPKPKGHKKSCTCPVCRKVRGKKTGGKKKRGRR